MGQTGSNMVKKMVSPFWGSYPGSEASKEMALARCGGNPFVYKRRGSMYMDEDGHLAHEFYEERRGKMRRLKKNLVPQGEVDLPYPRLHTDMPVVLCETPVLR